MNVIHLNHRKIENIGTQKETLKEKENKMKQLDSTVKAARIAMLVLLMGLLTVACGTGEAIEQAEERLTLSVTGYGEASGSPDLAQTQLGVYVVDPNVNDAINRANATIEAVTNAVISRGVRSSDVRTAYYSMWTEEIYDHNTGTPTGEVRYRVDITLSITVRDVNSIGQIISAGLDAGATNVAGINFSIDDVTALETEARGKALIDVRDRAEKMAQGMGMQLGKPLSIREGTGEPPISMDFGMGRGGGGDGAGLPSAISPGQSTIGMQVTIVYELLP